MAEVSSTRLYLGNLPRNATKADIESHFKAHGTGDIVEIKLMNGFGFVEYKDPLDARDVVPAFHGSDFMGERLTVQFARGTRNRDGGFTHERPTVPRPRRTPHRMQISGLPGDTSWQDLKDFARQSGLDVVYSETGRTGSGDGFVEFETADDLAVAIGKLDGREFKDKIVSCTASTQVDGAAPPLPSSTPAAAAATTATSREPRRSRSPPPGRRPYPSPRDEYERRGLPPRGGYSPPRWEYRDGYRDRSPPPRREYDDRGRYASPPPPPRRGPEDYPPIRRYEEPYRRDYAPPDPYAGGRPPYDRPASYDRPPYDRPYDRPPPPREFAPRSEPYREGGYRSRAEYDRPYW